VIQAVGFVGFGEAGFHIAKGLREAGLARTFAYDIDRSEQVRGRARETRTDLVESNANLAAACDVIFSAVTADQAANAVSQTAPYLRSRHYYADLNSVSPQMKQAIGRTVCGAGARFVEVAMMAPVPPHGHKVPMLLGGAAAHAFVELMTPFGVRPPSRCSAASSIKAWRL
jgi:3-hydroxyisobutyrate dehydrogenase-like beta-hydroxyacid dehydrogenase